MPEPMWFPFPTLDDDDEPKLTGVNDPSIVVPDVEHPLEIVADDGSVLFRLRNDGTAEVTDPEHAEQAAAVFWREVINMARLLGIPIEVTQR